MQISNIRHETNANITVYCITKKNYGWKQKKKTSKIDRMCDGEEAGSERLNESYK